MKIGVCRCVYISAYADIKKVFTVQNEINNHRPVRRDNEAEAREKDT